jgi:hypothetical protein
MRILLLGGFGGVKAFSFFWKRKRQIGRWESAGNQFYAAGRKLFLL